MDLDEEGIVVCLTLIYHYVKHEATASANVGKLM